MALAKPRSQRAEPNARQWPQCGSFWQFRKRIAPRQGRDSFTDLAQEGQAVSIWIAPGLSSGISSLGQRQVIGLSAWPPTAGTCVRKSIELDERGCPGFLLVTPQGAIYACS